MGDDSGPTATFEVEAVSIRLTGGPVAGVDEAGRGPLAGPVVAAAVILDPERIPAGIADSKLLEPEVREELYHRIAATARFGVGVAGVARIDRTNILQATLWAMRQAVRQLDPAPSVALGTTGLTANFAQGAYAVDNTYTATGVVRHTSLLCKRGSLAFWYNRAALRLQTDRDILSDADVAAMHLYAVAHRYRHMNGRGRSGVVVMRHA